MEPRKKSLAWTRLACAGISAAALLVVFHRLEFAALADAFRAMRRGWFFAATLLYGLAFLPATWRWHVVLRLTGNAVHPGATARLTLIGHFFYTILFGAIGGDAAKAALYARWHRLPLPSILATAPLDRLLGFAGLLVFTAIALGLAAATGAFAIKGPISLEWPGRWAIVIVILSLAMLIALKRSKPESAWGKFGHALFRGGKLLLASPRAAFTGLFCGLLVQVALNGVMALNLQAISHKSLPWNQLLWTFPVIAIVSALPITVAGLGTREGAALALLGLYGIPSADAVAASLLTFSAALFWAVVGGLLFWSEGIRQLHRRSIPKTISVVIPTLNEANALAETVRRARAVPEISEIIVVDGGSRDATRQIAEQLGCRVLLSAPGRGGQMQRGAAEATGDVVLLLHADTWLPPQAGQALLNCLRDGSAVGGGFWKVFRERNPLLFGSRFRCAIRLYLGRRIAGDQAIFVRREVLEAVGGVPDMPLMEEFELCRRLRQVGRLALADATIETSARRFEKLGVARTYLRMWWVTLRYYLGTEPRELRRIYEKE